MKVLGHVYHPRPRGPLAVLLISEAGGAASYLASSGGPVALLEKPLTEFKKAYERSTESHEHLAKIYLHHATTLGIEADAAKALSYLITTPEGLTTMKTPTNAALPRATKKEAPVTAAKAKKNAAAADAEAADAALAKKNKAEKPPKADKPKEKRVSVSSRICELIMEGKKTDEQIFATVQKEFSLDDGKRGYVTWNRAHLRKLGQNPPEPVGGPAPRTITKKPEPPPAKTASPAKQAAALKKLDAQDPTKKGAKKGGK